jgi:Ca2+-transporting ATPase
VGIVAPPRPEAKVAIEKARAAGIQVRMITGDHAVTAAAIAQQLGIPGRAISGAEFAALSEEQAQAQIGEIGVIARVAPEDKVRLVNILKRGGNIVAMTGDGVNDAPALKTADIGVAMGITGTDVSKEAAVMILTDDNFATIIRAVENGRTLYENLMKYIRFQMGTLFAWILTFLGAAIFNILGGVPMQPLQVLLIKFSIIIFLAIGLGLGNPRPEVMQDKPRKAGEQIMPAGLAISLGVSGLIRAASVLVALVIALNVWGNSTAVAQTMTMVTFSVACIFFALECNDQLRSVFSQQTLESTRLIRMIGWSLLLLFVVTYMDFLHRLLGTADLTLWHWVVAIALGSLVLWTSEIEKIFRRRAAARTTATAAETAAPATPVVASAA